MATYDSTGSCRFSFSDLHTWDDEASSPNFMLLRRDFFHGEYPAKHDKPIVSIINDLHVRVP